MPIKLSFVLRLALAAGLVGVLAGCTLSHRRTAHGTSIVQFLYPREIDRIDLQTIPHLALPLRVGIAFVPSGAGARDGGFAPVDAHFSEAAKAELLKRITGEFRGLGYVKTIELISSSYLRPGGGFENLDQVKAMFGVDVIALVAYDQVQFTDGGFLSLAYWTIVGAYVVQGEKNDTQTLMETVVYDIASRKLLFRAPGTSQVKALATPVNLQESLRTDSGKGFALAADAMTKNLKAELESFRERVKQAPEEFKVVNRPGYSGAGALDGTFAAVIAVSLGAAWLARRRG